MNDIRWWKAGTGRYRVVAVATNAVVGYVESVDGGRAWRGRLESEADWSQTGFSRAEVGAAVLAASQS